MVAFVTTITPWGSAAATAVSGSFTPTAGNSLIVFENTFGQAAATLTCTGTGTYTQLSPPGNLSDSDTDTHGAFRNPACSGGAQTITVGSVAGTSLQGWAFQYSGVASFVGAGNVRNAPGTGVGAILGTAVVVPVGGILIALCVDVAGAGTLSSPSGTNRGSGTNNGVHYCVTEYTGAGASITPSFTNSVNDDSVVTQILMNPLGGQGPYQNFMGPGRGPRATQHFRYSPFASAVTSTPGVLSGVSVATHVAAGNLTGAGALAGVSVSTHIAAGSLTGAGALAGSSVSTTVATGNLQGSGILSGTAVSTTAATGNLTGAGALAGTSVATHAATGDLRGAGALTGISVSTSAATGDLRGGGSLSGVSAFNTIAVGDLQNLSSGSMSGIAIFRSVAAADLGGAGILSGVSVSTHTATGNLTAAGGVVGSTLHVGFISNVGTLDNPVPRT